MSERNSQVPTRRFGRTEVQMPVLTVGGMRYQQAWDDLAPEAIDTAGQANLHDCIHHALDHGMNHIETARGYGSSEMQLGWILPKLDRDRLIVQTKVGVKPSASEFIETFETSMKYLQLDYVDFLSIHGINLPEHIDVCLGKGGCLEGVRQLQREGRVRFCGFSTHAGPEVVVPLCKSGEFDYVNLHWYYIYHPLHWPMVQAAAAADMGVFIISPNDKGGMLYHPTEKMQQLCQPLTPMQWNDLFCLSRNEVHTLSIGAARPTDFDEHIEAVTTFWEERTEWAEKGQARIEASMKEELGADWVERWFEGLPHYTDIPGQINVKEILRLWTFYKGLDLVEFARMRYNLLGTADHWFPGQQALEVDQKEWSCLSASPFSARIPDILKEAHECFHTEEEQRRLSEQ